MALKNEGERAYCQSFLNISQMFILSSEDREKTQT